MPRTSSGSRSCLGFGRAAVWLALLLAGVLLVARPARAVPEATLWVVQPPGEIVAFDVGRFERIGAIRLPSEAYRDPSELAINGLGQILAHLDPKRLWLWDGESSRELPVAPEGAAGPGVGMHRLAGDGASLVVLESVVHDSAGPGVQAESLIVLRRTGLDQAPRDTIAAWRSRHCECPIRLISWTEPCPGPQLYAAGSVVRDGFAAMWWEQDTTLWHEHGTGARGSCMLSRFTRNREGWHEQKGWSNGELPLDLVSDGSVLVVDPDDGCCGWQNDSSDKLLCSTPDTNLVVFDEWSRFKNQDYNVSFHAASARFSPDARRVACTVIATCGAAAEIRTSVDGRADTLKLARIRHALASLPLVRVTSISAPGDSAFELPHAEVVGWTSARDLIVVRAGQLIAVDVVTRRSRPTGIRVRTPADAIVARR
jgi:hypothetical protein